MLENQSDSNSQNPQLFAKETWHKHFESYQISGQTKAEYCRKHNLTYHRFIFWCGKFEKGNSSLAITDDGPAFVPIKLKSNSPIKQQTLCTLEFNDGKRLLIHDVVVLKALMSGL